MCGGVRWHQHRNPSTHASTGLVEAVDQPTKRSNSPFSAMKVGNMSNQKSRVLPHDMRYLELAGRQLFSVIFIIASAGHFGHGTIASAAQHGVPMAGLLVPASGLTALVGGLSLLFGYRARLGAWLLVLFLVPVTLTMHNFWTMSDPVMVQMQQAMFVRNLLMLGVALLIAHFGAGPLSLDAFMAEPVVAARLHRVNM
jgi:putative oxidoreductase